MQNRKKENLTLTVTTAVNSRNKREKEKRTFLIVGNSRTDFYFGPLRPSEKGGDETTQLSNKRRKKGKKERFHDYFSVRKQDPKKS